LDGTEGVQVKAMDQIGGEFEETKVKSVDSFFDLSFDAVDEIKLDVSETLLEFKRSHHIQNTENCRSVNGEKSSSMKFGLVV
jgi:hypothetical protein